MTLEYILMAGQENIYLRWIEAILSRLPRPQGNAMSVDLVHLAIAILNSLFVLTGSAF